MIIVWAGMSILVNPTLTDPLTPDVFLFIDDDDFSVASEVEIATQDDGSEGASSDDNAIIVDNDSVETRTEGGDVKERTTDDIMLNKFMSSLRRE